MYVKLMVLRQAVRKLLKAKETLQLIACPANSCCFIHLSRHVAAIFCGVICPHSKVRYAGITFASISYVPQILQKR